MGNSQYSWPFDIHDNEVNDDEDFVYSQDKKKQCTIYEIFFLFSVSGIQLIFSIFIQIFIFMKGNSVNIPILIANIIILFEFLSYLVSFCIATFRLSLLSCIISCVSLKVLWMGEFYLGRFFIFFNKMFL